MLRLLRVLVLALLLIVTTSGPALAASPSSDGIAVREERLELDTGVELDTTLYLPEVTPAPAVLLAHGFGGDKTSVDVEARELAARGLVVLAWSARGFGASTGEIALNAPDAEVADARALVDHLAGLPEVRLDGPGDPRVGVTGASYGGALALLLAGYDPRVDALAPVITYNDLGQALFPNAGTTGTLPLDTPARGAFAPDGVFKRGWAGVFFSAGTTPEGGAVPVDAGDATCGRFTAEVCAAYAEAATTGRLSPATAALLEESSPHSVTDRIAAPTLLVQGEQDTLFGLDQADANAREIAADGTPVQVRWYAGGHDGDPPGAEVREAVGDWFDTHLAGAEATDPGFVYAVESGVRTRGDTATGRTVGAAGYPGLPGTPTLATRALPLVGEPRTVFRPAGGEPAAITSLPGLGGSLGSLAGRLAAATSGLPGRSATFTTPALDAPLLVTGAPRVEVTVARLPGQPAPEEAVLFASTQEITANGTRTLLGSAVAPLRVAVPSDGTPVTVTVTLPGVVTPVEAGNRLAVSVGTTDQGYAGGTEPAVWRVGVAGGLTVPVVPGEAVTASTVPLGPAIGIAVVLGLAALGWVGSRLVSHSPTRRAGTRADPAPLVIQDLAKTYRGGFGPAWSAGATRINAVQDVSFRVQAGTVLGLLGPNGAGKTTVLRMLMGLIRPTAGTISVFGEQVGPGAPVLARIGAFVEGPGFLPHLSGADNLRLYWAATGRPVEQARFDEACEIAGLGASMQRRVGTYSQGMRQRLAIAQAMLGLPELLVLDEPTNGLDPPQIHAMREVLRRYAAGGRTVLVSSHLLAEVEQTCDHVVVMHLGRVVADGTVSDIIACGGAATFAVDSPDRAATVLGGLTGVHAVRIEGGAVHAELNGTPRASAVRALVTAGVDVASAGPRRRLEDAFLQLVSEDGERTP